MSHRVWKWQQVVIDKEAAMSNAELFDAVLEQAGGNDEEGGFTDHAWWEFEFLKGKLRERLAAWLGESKAG